MPWWLTHLRWSLLTVVAAVVVAACGDEGAGDLQPDGRGDAGGPHPPTAEICDNGADDDLDGAGDCADPDCADELVCLEELEICQGGSDEDGDGYIDCDDADCLEYPACREAEICNNEIDDDDDGAVDCEDLDCRRAEVCVVRCGNGAVDPGEDCDGSLLGVCDAETEECVECRCAALPYCGDGVVNRVQEECDGADLTGCDVPREGCDDDCACVVTCGNNHLDDAEECDGDILGDCDPIDEICGGCECVTRPICGDDVVNAEAEECDGADRGSCLESEECVDCTCFPVAECGDGVVEGREECEAGDTTACHPDDEFCNEECRCENFCGDGILDLGRGEECDDGALNTAAARCGIDCLLRPVCGDWRLDPPEECEDGNTEDDDGCSSACELEPDHTNVCGDWIIVAADGEACDGSDQACPDGGVCAGHDCVCIRPTCGDGRLGDAEVCDPGQLVDAPALTCENEENICEPEHCQCVTSVCGDGDVTGDEACDFDVSGEAIGECQAELDEVCDPVDCQCRASSCGDGVIDGEDEVCDFDTLGEAFGCSEGELCDPSRCQCVTSICGDGVLTGEENCELDAASGDWAGCESGAPVCGRHCRCEADRCPAATVVDVPPPQPGDPMTWVYDLILPVGDGRYTSCGTGYGPEQVFYWRVPADGVYYFTTDHDVTVGSTADTVLAVRSQCSPRAAATACNDELGGAPGPSGLQLSLEVGEGVYIVVDSVDAAQADKAVRLEWGLATAVDAGETCAGIRTICAGDLVCIEEECGPDRCPDELMVVEVPSREVADAEWSYTGIFPDRPSLYTSCGEGDGAEVALIWTAPESGRYHFVVGGAFGDKPATVLSLRRLCHETGHELACDAAERGSRGSLDLALVAGEQVVIMVDSGGPVDVGSAFQLDWGRVITAFVGDACDGHTRRCASGLVCGPEALCQVAAAPSLDQVTALISRDPEVHLLLLAGLDLNQDVRLVDVEPRDDADAPLGSAWQVELDGDHIAYQSDTGEYEVQLPLEAFDDTDLAGYALSVRDSAGLESDTLLAELMPTPAAAEVCPLPWFASAYPCPASHVCRPPDEGEAPVCAAAAGDVPTLTVAELGDYLAETEWPCANAGELAVELDLEGTTDEPVVQVEVELLLEPSVWVTAELSDWLEGPDFTTTDILCLPDLLDATEPVPAVVRVIDEAGRVSDGLPLELPLPES